MSKKIFKYAKVIGSAGCGKTAHLMRLVDAGVRKFGAGRVGAVSYTKTAVEEIRERISRDLSVPKDTADNVRTIHSHCFKLLGLRKDQVADEKKAKWNLDNPDLQLPLKHLDPEEGWDSDWNRDDNYRLHETQNILRNRMVPKERWPMDVRHFHNRWDKWCFHNDLTDYTGMLEKVYERRLTPDIDVLFVDEAQDTSPLSMAIMNVWSEELENTTMVGDSLQAIFRFAGSVPEVFINYKHDHLKVLEQSYRVPRAVHAYARRIAEQITNRDYEITYRPTGVEGRVFEATEPDLSLPGEHMILVRCNVHIKRWKQFLLENSTTWHNPYRPENADWNPTETKLWKAARTYIALKDGLEITFGELSRMVREMRARDNLTHGTQASFDDRLEEIQGKLYGEKIDIFTLSTLGIFKDEFMSFRKPVQEVFKLKGQNGELMRLVGEIDIKGKPRIMIGTCHSAKGAECDHVWVDTRTSRKIETAISQGWRDGDPTAFDDECRVAYVACTRARRTLGLLHSGHEKMNRVLPNI